jgi:tetratricopeptide (TPR) repeat protein
MKFHFSLLWWWFVVLIGFYNLSFGNSHSQYDSLREVDDVIVRIQEYVVKYPSLEGYISLSILYYLKDDQWMQGGSWQALYYTLKSLKTLPESHTTFRALKYALEVHFSKLLILLGRYNEAVNRLDSYYHEIRQYVKSLPHDQRLSNLLLMKGDALLSSGNITEAKASYWNAIRIYKCNHQAYVKLAQAFSSNSSSFNVSEGHDRESLWMSRMPEDDLSYPEVSVDLLISLSTDTVSRVVYDERTKSVALVKKETRLVECTTGDSEVNGLDILYLHSNILSSVMKEKEEKSTSTSSSVPPVPFSSSVLYYSKLIWDSFFPFLPFSPFSSIDSSSSRSSLSSVAQLDLKLSVNPINKFHHLRLVLSTFHWTLYYLYEKKQDYSLSWFHLSQMRFLERFRLEESIVYNVSSSIEKAKYIQSFIKPDYWPKKEKEWLGIKTKIPIFIVGFFRSGSTLLETLLDTHPNIWGMGENSVLTFQLLEMQNDLSTLFASSPGAASSKKGIKVELRDEMKVILHKYGNRVITGMKRKYSEHYHGLSIMNDSTLISNYSIPSVSSSISSPFPSSSSSSVQIKRIVDKMLLNYLNIAFIHLLFPQAIILHTVRDPLDTLLSCMKNRFGDFSTYTLEFRTLIAEYISYLEVIGHYRKVLPMIIDGKGRKRKAVIDIRYEHLVANPKIVMKKVFDLIFDDEQEKEGEDESNQQCDAVIVNDTEMCARTKARLDADEIVDGFYRSDRLVRTASFLQVKQPIYEKSIGNWKKYSYQLQQTIIPQLRLALTRLSSSGLLPYTKDNNFQPKMNWELKADFNYTEMIEKLRDVR